MTRLLYVNYKHGEGATGGGLTWVIFRSGNKAQNKVKVWSGKSNGSLNCIIITLRVLRLSRRWYFKSFRRSMLPPSSGSMDLRNVGVLPPQHYMASQLRRHQFYNFFVLLVASQYRLKHLKWNSCQNSYTELLVFSII